MLQKSVFLSLENTATFTNESTSLAGGISLTVIIVIVAVAVVLLILLGELISTQ